jgi:hypothetical protein
MQRIDENTIAFTQDEANSIHEFIRNSLEWAWDRHTSCYICNDSLEAGMRRMNPEMYDFAEQLNKLGD